MTDTLTGPGPSPVEQIPQTDPAATAAETQAPEQFDVPEHGTPAVDDPDPELEAALAMPGQTSEAEARTVNMLGEKRSRELDAEAGEELAELWAGAGADEDVAKAQVDELQQEIDAEARRPKPSEEQLAAMQRTAGILRAELPADAAAAAQTESDDTIQNRAPAVEEIPGRELATSHELYLLGLSEKGRESYDRNLGPGTYAADVEAVKKNLAWRAAQQAEALSTPALDVSTPPESTPAAPDVSKDEPKLASPDLLNREELDLYQSTLTYDKARARRKEYDEQHGAGSYNRTVAEIRQRLLNENKQRQLAEADADVKAPLEERDGPVEPEVVASAGAEPVEVKKATAPLRLHQYIGRRLLDTVYPDWRKRSQQ